MTTISGPSLRATTHVAARPTEADVAKARWVEAKAITDALQERLGRERQKLRAASEEGRIRVERRVQVTRLELTDAQAYEARVFAAWEHERSFMAGRPAAGHRSDESRPHGYSGVSIAPRALAGHEYPLTEDASTTSRRTA